MKLYFENAYGKRELIGNPSSERESMEIINNYCARNGYNIPNVNTWVTPNLEKHYDVSAGNEHFVVTLW